MNRGSLHTGAAIRLSTMKTIYEQILEHLTPLVGDVTARNLLSHYTAKMKLAPEQITTTNLEEFATSIQPMLAVWLGSLGARQVALEITQFRS